MNIILKNLLSPIALAVAFLIGALLPAAAQDNYVIKPGDVLQVEVLEDSALNRQALVLPDGSISFPMAGSVRVQGRSVGQVSSALSAALATSFAAPPNVYVSVATVAEKRPRAASGSGVIDVFALGEFEEPGRKEVKPGITLLQFLAEAGGLSRFAADKRIELHRTAPNGAVTTYRFNYRTPAGGEDGINGGTKLTDGDVIKAPSRRLFE